MALFTFESCASHGGCITSRSLEPGSLSSITIFLLLAQYPLCGPLTWLIKASSCRHSSSATKQM